MNNKMKELPMPDKSEQELLKEFTFGNFIRYDQFMEELARRNERDNWQRDFEQYEIRAD